MQPKGVLLSLILVLLLGASMISAETETVSILPHTPLKKLTGFTSPREELTVIAEVNGRCISITADIGAAIPEDGIIAEIDRTFIELELEDNRIARERVQRQLVEEEKSLRRYSKLMSEKSTAQARFDEVALAADLHRLELKSLTNVARRLNEQLERHTIPAPPGWKVIERYATSGEYLQAGSAVAKLGDFDNLLVSFGFTSEELKRILELSELHITLPEVKATVTASIYRISPVLDPGTRKIMVDLLVKNDPIGLEKQLRGGMRVEFSFPDTTGTGVFEIPSAAVISKYEANWLVRPDGSTVRVISLGTSGTSGITLVTGDLLEAGQRFLLYPGQAEMHGQE